MLVCFFTTSLTQGQGIKGRVIDSKGEPMPGVEVTISHNNAIRITNGVGVYRFFDVPPQEVTITIGADDPVSIKYIVKSGENLIDDVIYEPNTINSPDNQISIISVDDLDQIDDDDNAISSVLTASRDPFDRAVAFNLSVLRYRARGYNNEDVGQFLNGMPVNDLDDGRVYWNNWGGLNDVLRVQTNNLNLRASDFTFGELGGANFVDLRASLQRVQRKLVYSLSNRSYTHRVMYTHSTGMMENGWAFTFSGSKRWAQSGFIDGTHYDAYSYFVSVDRQLNEKNLLNFVFLGAPLRRGKVGPTVQEAYDLAGSNYYNPNWGFQNGEVRNSREDRVHQPIAILRHDLEASDKFKLTTTLGLQTGKFGNTRLDWYLAPDPRPDYYRKLPSFQQSADAIDATTEFFTSSEANRQLNWDNLYNINRQRVGTIYDVDGVTGVNRTGNLAAYVIEEQRFDNTKMTLNSFFAYTPNYALTLNGGITYIRDDNHSFKVLDDLLGAEFYVDYDDFAIRDFPANQDVKQNDLNRPNRIIEEGDVFGFDYNIITQNAGGWLQAQYVTKHLDYFVSGKAENVSFYRVGNMKVGKFPDNSFGKSETYNFLTYGTKAGVTYKLNGRNYFYAVGGYKTRAPFSRFAYVSPRTRDNVVDEITTEKIISGEVGYTFRFPSLKGRVSGFYTEFRDQLDNSSFFLDDANTFVNYVMTGIDKVHSGLELGLAYNLPLGFSIEAAGAYNRNFFTSRPKATITRDNSPRVFASNRTVYIDNYYVPGPQTATSITLGYNAKNFWFVNLTGSYVDDNYLDMNPERRTINAVAPINKSENLALWNSIIQQEKLPSMFTLNLFGGKSWRWDDYYLAMNLSIGNILDNTNLRTGGFEQSRFDYGSKDVNRFPPRYFYGFGRNYSINVSFAF